MLTIKSKYKLAKRLGAGVFDQTQTQKFALSAARSKGNRTGRRPRAMSDFGKQLIEKQRVRYTYGLVEKQFSNYVKKAMQSADPAKNLHISLETRLDIAAYRAGLASTRRAARQAVSHGHITVNGRRVTVPSYTVKKGDVISVREGSRTSPLFASLTENTEEQRRSIPGWLSVDLNVLRAEVVGVPEYVPAEIGLDYSTVFEFYSR